MSKELLQSLLRSSCKPSRPLLSDSERNKFVKAIDKSWKLKKGETVLSREVICNNYHETIAFVNAVAWLAHQQDHHPDLKVSYSRCKISLSTHDADGITKNDFICAAKIDALLD